MERKSKQQLAGVAFLLVFLLNASGFVTGLSLIPLGGATGPGNEPIEESDTTKIARSRGYIAEEYKLITADWYNLSLTRILNPLFNDGKSGLAGKRPLFFVPGETSSGSIYLSGSQDVKPEDLSGQNLDDESVRESLACCEPSAKVLPLLASNCGHESFILNRRATPGSFNNTRYLAYTSANIEIGRTSSQVSDRCLDGDPMAGDYDTNEELIRIVDTYGRESTDPHYWNYSLDQLARFDLAQAMNVALRVSQQDKLSVVAWSSGCSLTLMMLVDEPAFNRKISNVILLAPTFFRAPTADIITQAARPVLERYVGPFSGKFHLTDQVKCLLKRGCYQLHGREACDAKHEVPPGRIGNRPTTDQERELTSTYAVSSHQMLQLLQNINRAMHHFNHGSPAANLARYGQAEPPVYDLSRVTLDKFSIWYGAFDEKVSQVDRLSRDLGVSPENVHFFNESDIYFDHSSVVFHQEVANLINLPALSEIQKLFDNQS